MEALDTGDIILQYSSDKHWVDASPCLCLCGP